MMHRSILISTKVCIPLELIFVLNFVSFVLHFSKKEHHIRRHSNAFCVLLHKVDNVFVCVLTCMRVFLSVSKHLVICICEFFIYIYDCQCRCIYGRVCVFLCVLMCFRIEKYSTWHDFTRSDSLLVMTLTLTLIFTHFQPNSASLANDQFDKSELTKPKP